MTANKLTHSKMTASHSDVALRKYAAGGHVNVAGWLEPLALRSIVILDRIQKEIGVEGGMCEIGVHRARLLILLHLLSREGERTIGFDLFELMDAELSAAYGSFSKVEIVKTLIKHGCDLERIDLVAVDSTSLRPEDVSKRSQQTIRMFSVDGGHDANTALSDIRLAGKVISTGGLVFVDDTFNEQWCGVIEATARFLQQSDHGLIPFLQSGNKMFFTTSQCKADDYRERMTRELSDVSVKVEKFFGYPVLIAWQAQMSKAATAFSLLVGDEGLKILRGAKRLLTPLRASR